MTLESVDDFDGRKLVLESCRGCLCKLLVEAMVLVWWLMVCGG